MLRQAPVPCSPLAPALPLTRPPPRTHTRHALPPAPVPRQRLVPVTAPPGTGPARSGRARLGRLVAAMGSSHPHPSFHDCPLPPTAHGAAAAAAAAAASRETGEFNKIRHFMCMFQRRLPAEFKNIQASFGARPTFDGCTTLSNQLLQSAPRSSHQLLHEIRLLPHFLTFPRTSITLGQCIEAKNKNTVFVATIAAANTYRIISLKCLFERCLNYVLTTPSQLLQGGTKANQ